MSNARDKTAAQAAGGAPAAGSQPAGNPGGQAAGYRDTGAARGDYGTGYQEGRAAARAGGTVLAAVLMMLSGMFGFLEGLVAILRRGFFVTTTPSRYIYQFDIHGWGWLLLAIGIALFAAGFCVLLGQTWAKLLGIALAVFSGLANFMFLPYSPVWSIIMVAIDVFIIWSLATGISRRASA